MDVYISSIPHGGPGSGCCRYCDPKEGSMAKKKVQATRAQVFQRGDGWRFRIKAANGEVLATGESYENKDDALAAATALVPADVVPEVSEV